MLPISALGPKAAQSRHGGISAAGESPRDTQPVCWSTRRSLVGIEMAGTSPAMPSRGKRYEAKAFVIKVVTVMGRQL